MDENKTEEEGNQNLPNQSETPIFESENLPREEAVLPEEIVPEELSEENFSEAPPIYQENRNKYLFIGLGVIFFVVVLVIIVKILTGLGKDGSKKISLTYWGLWEEKEAFQPLIADYKRKNPQIDIVYTKMDYHDYREKVLERGKKGKGPDIFRFHNTWVPSLKEVLAPLPKNIMSDQEFENTFYPVVKKDLKVGNFYYGIPLEIDGLVLLYNDNLFKRTGLETAPKTWEDITNYASQLTTKDQSGRIITSGIALGMASNVEHFSDIFGVMLLQNGADLRNLTSTEAVGALEAYRKFAEVPNNLWDESMPNSVAAFIQEKVAMIIVPSWEILVIKQSNPDISLKITALPVVPGGIQISLANYWVEGVSKYSQNQLEGWKFLRFLVEKDNLTKFYEGISKMRLFGEPYSRVDLSSVLLQNEYIGPIIQQAKNMESLPLVARTYDNGINDEIIKYLENAINSTINGVSYSEALNTAQKGIEQVFKKYEME
jgi:multiple sugar transport system substrate-binding protein